MCLILFAWKKHPDYRLILAANRDEFHDRPTESAHFWPDAPQVLAGRDQVAGGTWLGMTRSGRLAAVANVREPADRRHGTPSRGQLVADFLRGAEPPVAWLGRQAERAKEYKGYNLLAAEGDELGYYSNRDGRVRSLAPGLYGLSNALLDTPWPKVAGAKAEMGALLSSGGTFHPEDLFRLLADTSRPADDQLPDTGVGLELERLLSSRFIVSPRYGTRASTVVLIGTDGEATFVERTFDPAGQCVNECRHDFAVSGRG
jgi:uncharacterized protein with NRDE domain